MQIVIDIPEETYVWVLEEVENKGFLRKILYDAIADGTVITKGHGRLIDEKEVYKKFYCRCLAGVAKDVLEETQTIIEADKESEEEE